MRSAEHVPVGRMSRVAVVSPRARARDALVELARAGCVELAGNLPQAEGDEAEALRRLKNLVTEAQESPALLRSPPEVSSLERRGKIGLLTGEVELQRRSRLAVEHGSFSAWVGWAPTARLEELSERLAKVGSGLVELPRPAWVEPPTVFRPAAVERPFRPLVRTYGTPRYWDVDPTRFTAASFIVMFGMMFGDVGHGLVLAVLGLWLRRRRTGRLAEVRDLWVIVFFCGLAGACFGLLYGEAFGPTGLVPRLWLDPVEDPSTTLSRRPGHRGRAAHDQLSDRNREPLERERPCARPARSVGGRGSDDLDRRRHLRGRLLLARAFAGDTRRP